MKQPPGFEDLKHPDYVYKLKKSLYGLKQAPRAWCDRLSNFLLKNDFKRGQVDTTLFKKTLEKDILVVQIYVDDIIFGSTNGSLCKEFSKMMQDEFEMSMMGESKVHNAAHNRLATLTITCFLPPQPPPLHSSILSSFPLTLESPLH